MYYGLTDYYQNFRHYVQSRDDKQLLGNPGSIRYQCKPYDRDPRTGFPIFPCGTIANSLFNGETGAFLILLFPNTLFISLRTSYYA